MSRLRDRVRNQAGLSLIELLVTVLMAGVVFSALVPLVLQTSQATASERSRSVARNVAQQVMERIRMLDYDAISTANLNDGGALADEFGNTIDVATNAGSSEYLVAYEVTEKSIGTRRAYKVVSVTVSWKAPPEPVVPVTVITDIYKQWDGPKLTSLVVDPVYTPIASDFETAELYEEHLHDQWLSSDHTPGTVNIIAVVDPYDVANSMVYPGDPTIRGYVKFWMTPERGAGPKPVVVQQPVGTSSGTYKLPWDWSTASEGRYTIKAVAFSFAHKQGGPYETTVIIERGAPPAPAGLTATPGDQQVILKWAPSTAGDYDHYVVQRTSDETGETTVLSTDLQTSNFTDTPLENGKSYTYNVYVVDQNGRTSAAATASATPNPVAGALPTAAYDLKAVAQMDQIILTWMPPQASPIAVTSYDVFKNGAFLANTSTTQYPDVCGWDVTAAYQVKSRAVSGLSTDYAALISGQSSQDIAGVLWATASTGAQINTYTIQVTAPVHRNVTATLYYSPTGASFTAVGTKSILAGQSEYWYMQPQGYYYAEYPPSKRTTTTYTSGPSGSTVTLVF